MTHWQGNSLQETPSNTSARIEVSVVVPAYREAGNLRELHRQIASTLAQERFELVLVDDGSPDDTWREIRALHGEDTRVVGLRLSRNFGHQSALIAGLSVARGAAVITMDADLQHPPSVLPQLLEHWRSGKRIVHTVREDATDTPAWKRTSSRVFYRVFSKLAGLEMRAGLADFRLLDREVLEVLLHLPERNLFLRGMVQWVGYETAYVPFLCGPRHAGETSYTPRRMISLGWRGINAFSNFPLRFAVGFGLCASLVASYQFAVSVYVSKLTDSAVPGWASAVGLMSLLFATLFVVLGVIGEYLAQVLDDVRARPRFLISEHLVGPAGSGHGRADEGRA